MPGAELRVAPASPIGHEALDELYADAGEHQQNEQASPLDGAEGVTVLSAAKSRSLARAIVKAERDQWAAWSEDLPSVSQEELPFLADACPDGSVDVLIEELAGPFKPAMTPKPKGMLAGFFRLFGR
jgi:hypothetical protein